MKVYLTIQSNYSEKSALQTLKASDWHLEGAFDVFYSQPQSKSFTDSRHLEELFNRYKGKLYLNSCFCSLSSTSLLHLFVELDRKSTRLNSSHVVTSRMPSSA